MLKSTKKTNHGKRQLLNYVACILGSSNTNNDHVKRKATADEIGKDISKERVTEQSTLQELIAFLIFGQYLTQNKSQ